MGAWHSVFSAGFTKALDEPLELARGQLPWHVVIPRRRSGRIIEGSVQAPRTGGSIQVEQQRGTGFTEYDIHLADDAADPKASPGIVIEIRTEEMQPGDWPEELQQGLDEIVQADPSTGRASVNLRVTCAWNATTGGYEPAWEFLNAARTPLVGQSARRTNLERFWQYLPVFYLSALRDADDEFSARSQFWGRLLKAMKIPDNLEGKVKRVLDLLNKKLLNAEGTRRKR